MLRGVACGIDHRKPDIFKLDSIAFGNSCMREGTVAGFWCIDGSTGQISEIEMARDEVRVQVGFEDVGDLQVVL
jgi:hypothetical protein